MTTKALTFQFTLSGGTSYEKTFVAATATTAWLKAARYVFCHAMQHVVAIRLLRHRRIQVRKAMHNALPPEMQPKQFLLTY